MKKNKVKITKDNIKELLPKLMDEYQPDIVNDTDEMYELKSKIQKLKKSDRIIIILYTEMMSLQKVGELIDVTGVAIHNRIKKIREKISKLK